MLDFDFLCGRETPSVAGIINPGSDGFQKLFFGQEEIAIPVHPTIEAACNAHPTADVFINFASFRSAAASSMSALKQPTIRVVAIIAEGVPESDAKQLISYARANNKVIIGPATVGGIQAGAFKIGDTAGTIDNIIQCKLYRPGSVGFVSKSGGMSNEMYNTIARVTDGIYEGIAIGGDVFPGSTLSDHILRFNNIPQVKMMVVLGQLGGKDEYSLVEALKQGKVQKPVVAWVSGTCARLFKSEVQFGHAGAKSGGELESAQAKNQALREAGAIVPTSYEALESAIKETFDKLLLRLNIFGRLRKERFLLWLKLHLLPFPRTLKLQSRVGRSGLLPTSSPQSLMTEARNRAMLVSLCLQLLNRVMVLVMLSLSCGSSAAFLAIALSLLRYASCFALTTVPVCPVLITL
jgi:ATP citrate (pro-S)-lyase